MGALALALTACGQLLDLPERVALPHVASCAPEAGCACEPGWEDCDGVIDNGCEVDLLAGDRCQCEPHTWPQREDTDDGDDGPDIVLALRSVRTADGQNALGFDLDRRCTCDPNPMSACPCTQHCDCAQIPTAESCQPVGTAPPLCDGAAGEDNAANELFKLAGGLGGLSVKAWSDAANEGAWSALIEIKGYNGRPNDDTVDVGFFGATPFEGDPCNGKGSKPRWDGTDRWPLRADSLKGNPEPVRVATCGQTLGLDRGQSTFRDDHAYVVGGQLVAEWPGGVQLNLSGVAGDSSVLLLQTVLTGRLVQDGPPRPGESVKTWRLRGAVLGGRWSEDSVFRVAGSLKVGKKLVCDDTTTLALAKSLICPLLDVRTKIGGPNAPCDAMSFGAGFEAEEARFGSVMAATPVAECPPGVLEMLKCGDAP